MGGPVKLYWGAKAILARFGLKDPRRLPYLIRTQGIPAYLRRKPGARRGAPYYYMSENMATAYELSRARQFREQLKAKYEENGKA